MKLDKNYYYLLVIDLNEEFFSHFWLVYNSLC